MSDTQDKYKDTVFLPKTDFPMRGNLPEKEPEMVAKWQEMDLYGKIRQASAGKPKWILHDGPPYANGNIHMGHALNKILKDVINKSWQMMGYNAPYVPGWDCHGLPIEWKIEEKYRNAGKDKDDVDPLDFRAECREFAQEWVDIQSEQFQRLGVIGDWRIQEDASGEQVGGPYRTMTKHGEAQIAREIHKFLDNGGLYRGVKSVLWSTVEQTALAEAEVEYQEHKSVTIWARFPVVETKIDVLKGADVVIWTTTPWTIPSNRGIFYNDDIAYAVYEVTEVAEGSKVEVGAKISIAEALADKVQEQAKITSMTKLGEFKGVDVEGTICAHPLRGHKDANGGYDYDVPAHMADYVTDEDGTGFVHVAPSHGPDDFLLGQKYGLEITDNLDDDGSFKEHVPLFAGLKIYDENGKMDAGNFAPIKAMEEAGKLLAKGSLRHEYPHSWRSKAPLIFRTTPQWFIAMGENQYLKKILDNITLGNLQEVKNLFEIIDEALKNVVLGKENAFYNFLRYLEKLSPEAMAILEANLNLKKGLKIYLSEPTLRDVALKAIEETEWHPEKGKNRIRAMIEGRPDWCISRQRAWGVPIALFVDKKTGETLKDEAVLKRITDAYEEHGSDAWWSMDAQEFLGNDYSADEYEQIFDIVDVWFESGSTHSFVVNDREDLGNGEIDQVDLYLEGSDQHRGWFHSSLLESCGTKGKAPYKNVLTHGFVLDEKGYKMSKSLGNVVDPLKLMKQSGADILRLWTMTSDYAEDIRIGQSTMKNTGDLYRRIRNTLRFLLGALDGFNAAEKVDLSDLSKLPELEQLVLHQLYEMDQKLRGYIQNYEFGKLAKELHEFCNNNLSAFYFDIRKDRLYCDDPQSFERKACRSVMAEVYNCLTAWLAPILSFTAEEAWAHRPEGVFDDSDSVHLRDFPNVPKTWQNPALAGKWFGIRSIREEVFYSLELDRKEKIISSSLEANVTINLKKEELALGEEIDWAEVCIVSAANTGLMEGDTYYTGERVETEKAEGEKCVRCWKVLPEVAGHVDHICNRCDDVVNKKQAA